MTLIFFLMFVDLKNGRDVISRSVVWICDTLLQFFLSIISDNQVKKFHFVPKKKPTQTTCEDKVRFSNIVFLFLGKVYLNLNLMFPCDLSRSLKYHTAITSTKEHLGPVYTKCHCQRCNNFTMMLAILFSLKTMELLQNEVATHFQVTSMFSIRTESLASLQSCCSVDDDAWCKVALVFVLYAEATYFQEDTSFCFKFLRGSLVLPIAQIVLYRKFSSQ